MPRGVNREVLLETGMQMLHADGYEATGVGKITKAAGVPKGSFYNYFDSKEAFALEVLEGYVQTGEAMFTEVLEQGTGPHLVRLRRLYGMMIDQLKSGDFSKGCLAGALCQEMAGRDDAFKAALERSIVAMRSKIEGCLRSAQATGELARSHDPDRLARFLQDAWQGALIRMKVERSDRPLRDFLDLVFAQILS